MNNRILITAITLLSTLQTVDASHFLHRALPIAATAATAYCAYNRFNNNASTPTSHNDTLILQPIINFTSTTQSISNASSAMARERTVSAASIIDNNITRYIASLFTLLIPIAEQIIPTALDELSRISIHDLTEPKALSLITSLTPEQRYSFILNILAPENIKKFYTFQISMLLDHLTPEQQQTIALNTLTFDNIKNLLIVEILPFLNYLSSEQKQNLALNILIPDNIKTIDISKLKLFINYLSTEQQQTIVLNLLSFDNIQSMDLTTLSLLLDYFTPEQKQSFALEALSFNLNNNNNNFMLTTQIILLECLTPEQRIINACFISILDGYCKGKVNLYSFNYKFFAQLTLEQKHFVFFKILEHHKNTHTLHTIDPWYLEELLAPLTLEEKSSFCLQVLQHCLTDGFEKFNENAIKILLTPLPSEKQHTFTLAFLEYKINDGTFNDMQEALCHEFLNMLLPAQQQSLALNTLTFDNIKKLNSSKIDILFKFLIPEQQQQLSLYLIKEHPTTLDARTFFILVRYLPTEQQYNYIITKIPFAHYLMQYEPAKHYLLAYFPEILMDGSIDVKKPNAMETMLQTLEYAKEQHDKGNIVLFHGQSAQWAFIESIFKAAYEITHDTTIPDTFTFLRFTTDYPCEQTCLNLRTNGLETYHHDRFKLLFTNLVPFANYSGSNSLVYMTENKDQSATTNRYTETFSDIFNNLKLSNEFSLLEKDLETLKILFEEANNDQENHGAFIVISLPKDQAQKLVYPTTSGGPLKSITINGKETTDIIEISQNFDQVPFENEYCLILSKAILNPEEAQKAGIEIRRFSPAYTPSAEHKTEKYIAYETKLKEVMGKIKKHYQARKNVSSQAYLKRLLWKYF